MLVAVTSASGAPGASTTALALALHRKNLTLLVEADPVGSSPALAGYLRSEVPHRRSVKNLIDPDRIGKLRGAVGAETIRLPHTMVSVLPGLVHAGQSAAMARTWPHLAEQLAHYSESTTVVVDAGRMGTGPMELMRRADLIVIVVKPTLPCVAALNSALVPFSQDLAQHQSQARLGLIVIGDHFAIGNNDYDAKDIAKAVGVDLIMTLPNSPRGARVFSEGSRMTKWQQRRSLYLAALHRAWPRLEAFAIGHRPPWVNANLGTSSTVAPSLTAAGGAR